MGKAKVELPYFDALLEQFRQGEAEAIQAFGTHVHWGYWSNPAKADGSVGDFAVAAELLCQKVYNAAKVQDGDRILDTGCGFGGTIASINQHLANVQLIGLNIDERQLARAREEIKPRTSNQIEFVEGDACQIPFEDDSFDVVLAVECIFHFPSRERFFQEARRVLRTGGKLAICDFVPVGVLFPVMSFVGNFVKPSVSRTYGAVDSSFTLAKYRDLAKNTGFTPIQEEDITINTLPTYPVVRRIFRQNGAPESDRVTAGAQWASRLGLLRYLILAFEAK